MTFQHSSQILRVNLEPELSWGEDAVEKDWIYPLVQLGSVNPYARRDIVSLDPGMDGSGQYQPIGDARENVASARFLLTPTTIPFLRWAATRLDEVTGEEDAAGTFYSLGIDWQETPTVVRRFRGCIPRSVRVLVSEAERLIRFQLEFAYRTLGTVDFPESSPSTSICAAVDDELPYVVKNSYLDFGGTFFSSLVNWDASISHPLDLDRGFNNELHDIIAETPSTVEGSLTVVSDSDRTLAQTLSDETETTVQLIGVHPTGFRETISGVIYASQALMPVADTSQYTVGQGLLIEGEDASGNNIAEVHRIQALHAVRSYLALGDPAFDTPGVRQSFVAGAQIVSKSLGITIPVARVTAVNPEGPTVRHLATFQGFAETAGAIPISIIG